MSKIDDIKKLEKEFNEYISLIDRNLNIKRVLLKGHSYIKSKMVMSSPPWIGKLASIELLINKYEANFIRQVVYQNNLLEFYEQYLILMNEFLHNLIDIDDSDNLDLPLGKYAFPNKRTSVKLPYEKDTKIEKLLFRAIHDYIYGYSLAITNEYFDLITSFIKTNKYSDMFSQFRGEKVYRGMSVNSDYIDSIKDHDNFVFVPKDNIVATSWTHNLSKAIKFSQFNTGDYSIILCAEASKNDVSEWVDFRNLYYMSEEMLEYEHEEEVLIRGKVNVSIEKITYKS